MNYNEAKAKLNKYGQEHILNFWNRLSAKEQEQLLEQVSCTDFDIIQNSIINHGEKKTGKISPIMVKNIDEISNKHTRYAQLGTTALRDGKVAAVLLAGGMGTRLGSDDPKGMFDIGINKPVYIFQRLIENLMDSVNESGSYIHLFIMTSEKNNDATISFFTEKNFFGYPKEYVHFFIQEMAAATDYNGKVYLETQSRIATSPNGNGGWYISLKKAGYDKIIEENGIEWLNVFAVDNVLQRIADPGFIGAVMDDGCVCGAKVIKKADRNEKVGVLCLEDGHPSIIEYYELTDELRDTLTEDGEPAYNYGVILNYLFRIDELDKIAAMKLPLHIVEKKIPYADENGNTVFPEEPNGYKYETLILDMIKLLDSCCAYEVIRDKEFAPIKNLTGTDSVESARSLLVKNGVEL